VGDFKFARQSATGSLQFSPANRPLGIKGKRAGITVLRAPLEHCRGRRSGVILLVQ